ncbi:acyl-CoA/acyl-ACP dehydrogenase [Actinomycetospora endophytica]|uniref:Acyl-CoA/acyl-ACP dehydrogenase n=1 Tax=Actinomycetospora endophytica TaxID=2291215 RepID=A0ABS8PAK4_9PSEU|nr:acyl-CoA dehydrogenase family protein [Actinomycetospora endophytica]MCD2194441.1 acyl-CoA/acyl-ACP dehydrogenase [Actinomycetospora endophytica]
MFFALTDEQQAFASTVSEFLADRFDLDAVRGVVEDSHGDGHPLTLWKGLADQGALAVLVPEEHDGLGLGLVDAQVVARALGAGVAPGPWLGTVLAAEAVRLAGSAEQQARWLPALAAGETVGTVALRGEGGAWDGSGITVDANDGRLSGSASPVDYPGVAGLLVVAATDSSGTPGLYVVEAAASGLSVRDQQTYDGTARVGAVELADTPAEALTAGGPEAVRALLARGAVLNAADLVGVAREALTRTVAYDRERTQFGVPVGSFQAIKHRMADLHVAVTMAEHAVLFAAYALDSHDPGADVAVAVAGSKASDAAWEATGAMIQFFGGIGFTWEHEAHFFYKRARRRAPLFGSADEHRERLAALTI